MSHELKQARSTPASPRCNPEPHVCRAPERSHQEQIHWWITMAATRSHQAWRWTMRWIRKPSRSYLAALWDQIDHTR